MEAMKKLDADLVALFATAGEPKMEQLKKKQQQQLWPEPELADQELPTVEEEDQEQLLQEQELATPELFKKVNAVQLHLEALTLQPEGTKRMELLQNEVRPIFTVECQLSDDLIRSVPRTPMFHLMQFESEKFQSLTQCTRFGQTQQREVHLQEMAADQEMMMGSIYFTIWWREPGTCLNELLGMGRLPLAELYQASLLEQCKCIVIQRRDVHLASLYLKISLRADQQLMLSKALAESNNNNNNNNSNDKNYHSAAAAANNNKNNNSNNNNNSNSNSHESNSTKAASTPTPPEPTKNNNNKATLDSVNFMAETTKVRLLRGYIYASEMRHLSAADADGCKELVLQPFWQSESLTVPVNPQGNFQLQEQFAIINDEKFLHSVERQQLVLDLRPLGGKAKLPLHQFYIAYKDASITNHLFKGKLPVISIDGWTPIVHPETQAQLGELKVLLAIGSEAQIAQLKQLRGFDQENNQEQPQRRTSDLLDMLQNALSAPVPTPLPPPAVVGNKFSFSLHIVGAAGLPLNPGYGKSGKKQAKRQAAAKRFPPNEPPNTYVTFQALSCNAQTYKSHEGLVYATPIVERSTTPQWHSKFQVEIGADYLSNPQKLFVLKLWKKTALSAGTSTEPTPLEDAIIGFAALNLNRSNTGGFPSGWHNIVDFNGRVTGGLEIHVQPMPAATASGGNVDSAIDQFEQTLELRHLQLGQAIKRKYTELEQISNRLRTRLVDVTGQPLQSQGLDVDAVLGNWQPDEMQQGFEDDELVADFERALRTPTPPLDSTDATDIAESAQPTAQSRHPADDAGKE
ncbi:uncharacterized protein LOC133846504 isoform X2 [Drosophila sulfurigaster albostrigata]|nr:uncharacterized protein LOC133846504 isoform X2 [Drosophila sulfurigaster albostrigata]XP_062137502.1 uncharacterized protein LOC133846504 isoform X2 [Drosophila sulfurigaster albostrigata]XP_062137503.1 uncharacterized protein LOC133846504 isoform X2 [Drosophila sulfurigaster albostrigata]XP_062137504.1 uncharacterized protein LOC133846504 isoform X2 [Drosophila sulfurigaster albostrigata]XP_062137505.1 uncharacterized protein LOC133846504 isoform X2 [Drosophila sulfurigaster albostrigata]